MYLKALDREKIINILKNELPELQAIYIFGSQKDGSARSGSDIDIAYLSKNHLSSLERWKISQKLALSLSTDVDLIELTSTNTIFRYQIISTAERIYGDGYEVENFETLAYSFYLRFKQERQPIIDEIYKNRSIFGVKDA